MTSGVMYLRLIALIARFNRHLVSLVAPAFCALALIAIGAGWFWSARPDATSSLVKPAFEAKNLLELTTAFLFTALFLIMLVGTQLVVAYLGRTGVNTLAALMGITDVDPFIMGMTQAAGSVTSSKVAAVAVTIAAASNNLIKGIYARRLADRRTGAVALGFLAGLGALGLLPLLWL